MKGNLGPLLFVLTGKNGRPHNIMHAQLMLCTHIVAQFVGFNVVLINIVFKV